MITAQNKQILRFMEYGGVITPRIASRLFDCDRLSARIWDLRHMGVMIADEWDYKLDNEGRVVKKWKKYWIKNVSSGQTKTDSTI